VSGPTILRFGSINQFQVESILYVLCLVMVFNAKIIVFLRTQTWVVRVALVVLTGI
jgi:hypothetical protein